MSNVLIRVPRRTKRVHIIKAEDLIQQELDSYRYIPPAPEEPVQEGPTEEELAAQAAEQARIEALLKEKAEEAKIPIVDIPVPPKTVFTQTFTLNNQEEPTEISLKNIPADSITINEAKIEIQSAYDTGFKHGKETSDAQFRKDIERKDLWVKSIDSVVEKMRSEYINELKKFEDVIIDTSVAIAEKIIQREIEADSSVIINQVKNALAVLPTEKILEIRVSPRDYRIIRKAQADIINDPTRMREVEFLADINIQDGECLVKSASGNVATKITDQLDRIAQDLEGVFDHPNYHDDKIRDPESVIDLERVQSPQQTGETDDSQEFQRPDLTKLDLFKDY
jgi:flagellar assembly protein FliH